MYRRLLLAACALSTSLLAVERAQADEADPWFGRDKMLHFAASAGIAASGYTAGALAFDARYEALLFGGGLALAAGTAKELRDMAGYGDPSWRDFTWDLVGTVAGLALSWGIDLAVRGTGDEHPALAIRKQAFRPALVLTF